MLPRDAGDRRRRRAGFRSRCFASRRSSTRSSVRTFERSSSIDRHRAAVAGPHGGRPRAATSRRCCARWCRRARTNWRRARSNRAERLGRGPVAAQLTLLLVEMGRTRRRLRGALLPCHGLDGACRWSTRSTACWSSLCATHRGPLTCDRNRVEPARRADDAGARPSRYALQAAVSVAGRAPQLYARDAAARPGRAGPRWASRPGDRRRTSWRCTRHCSRRRTRRACRHFLEATIGPLIGARPQEERPAGVHAAALLRLQPERQDHGAAPGHPRRTRCVSGCATIEDMLGHWGNAARALEIHMALRLWSLMRQPEAPPAADIA